MLRIEYCVCSGSLFFKILGKLIAFIEIVLVDILMVLILSILHDTIAIEGFRVWLLTFIQIELNIWLFSNEICHGSIQLRQLNLCFAHHWIPGCWNSFLISNGSCWWLRLVPTSYYKSRTNRLGVRRPKSLFQFGFFVWFAIIPVILLAFILLHCIEIVWQELILLVINLSTIFLMTLNLKLILWWVGLLDVRVTWILHLELFVKHLRIQIIRNILFLILTTYLLIINRFLLIHCLSVSSLPWQNLALVFLSTLFKDSLLIRLLLALVRLHIHLFLRTYILVFWRVHLLDGGATWLMIITVNLPAVVVALLLLYFRLVLAFYHRDLVYDNILFLGQLSIRTSLLILMNLLIL